MPATFLNRPRRCPYCRGTGVCEMPVRMPRHVKEFIALYPEVPAQALVCPEHGQWFTEIDVLAPYHWETCRCQKCP